MLKIAPSTRVHGESYTRVFARGWPVSLFAKLRGGRNYVATIDAAKAAPPPSPLAPVDLTDPAQVTGVMEIAARIGCVLLESGTANSDARAQVYLAAASYGLHYCHIDVVMNTVTIHTNVGTGADRRPITVVRVAQGLAVDFGKLTEVDRLIRSIHSGATPPALAEKLLDEIESKAPPYPMWMVLLAWGVMGGFIAVLLGGNLFVAAVSACVAMLIMGVNAWLERLRLPSFYQNLVGGFIAVLPAAVFYHIAAEIGLTFAPSQVIGMGILVLVAGLTLVQCLVDGITRAPVTSSARFFEALLTTAAIVAGVGLGIQVADMVGLSLPPLATIAPPVFHQIPLRILCGGVGSAAFALACYASWPEVVVSGLTAASGMVFYYLLTIPLGMGAVVASGVAAVAVGLAGGLLSRRFLIPPLVTMIVGYTPMLPGLTLYRGMYASMNEQQITGFTNLATSLAIAGALAAGVVLGERGARRLRRPKYFRPYAAFKRFGRYSVHQASRLAARAQRIPRVPMSPFAPRAHRPELPPIQGPMPEQPKTDMWPEASSWPAQPRVYTSPGTGVWSIPQSQDDGVE